MSTDADLAITPINLRHRDGDVSGHDHSMTAAREDHTDTAPTYWIKTYGCQMNVHDSEIYAGLLEETGYRPATGPETADLILLNTCSVREKAEEKLFSELGRLRPLKHGDAPNQGHSNGQKSNHRNVLVGVTGCIAQQRGGGIRRRDDVVDFVIGTRSIHSLPQVLDRIRQGAGPQVMTADSVEFEAPFARRRDQVKAFVTIMEGCNNYCSFCIVPTTRGLEVYRREAAILDEVRALSLRGFREVTLLGQNVNSWVDPERGTGFPELLIALDGMLREMTAEQPGGVERIRFLTSHPKDLSPRLIDAMEQCTSVANHLHLPVQSGSDRVLELMNRHYTARSYLDQVRRLRERVGEVGLSTDLIVGFPGETEKDFVATLELVRAAEYDSFYSFEYSPRPETTALRYPDDVAPEIKRERLLRLQALGKELQEGRNAAWVSRETEVLFDGLSRRATEDVSGRTSTNHIVNARGEENFIGRMAKVRITGSGPHSLYGEIIDDSV